VWYVAIIGIIACNYFGFKESGNTHWTYGCSSHCYFPFSQVFIVTGRSQFSYVEIESTFALKRCHLCTYRSKTQGLNDVICCIPRVVNVRRQSGSYNAYCLKVALYGHVSHPSDELVVFSARVSYILGCKPRYFGCVICRIVSFISFFVYELYCLVYSKRVARRVMNFGV